MNEITAAIGPFIENVLKGLEAWTIHQIMIGAPAILAVIASVSFVRQAYQKITKKRPPEWALVSAPLVAGVAFLFVAKIVFSMVGIDFPQMNPVQKVIIGVGLGMVSTLAFKGWRMWRRSKKK